MKTILATTYAVNPYKGSEDAMGWNYVMQIARFHKVIAFTRENNQENIEKYMAENPDDRYQNIEFYYFDLPYWMRFWKKKNKGALIYFYMWQRGVVNFIKRQKIDYDIVHNLNFHNDWTPSFLWKLKKPFVWGPIGHHPRIPEQHLHPYSIKYKIKDKLTWLVKKAFWNWSPSVKNTIKHADHIMCMNSSVPQVIDLNTSSYTVSPSVATQDFGWTNEKNEDQFTVISAGRFVPLKGFDLTIKSFASFIEKLPTSKKEKCKLIIVGDGPEKDTLRNMVISDGISSYVQFISWIERDALMGIMRASSVFLFPSHEGAGMVIPEALSFGLPTVVLDNWGPGRFINDNCGFRIKPESYDKTVMGLANALNILFEDKNLRKSMRNNARELFVEKFHWDRKGEELFDIYTHILPHAS